MAVAAAPARSRPRPVAIASYLLYMLAALPIASALIQLSLFDDFKQAAERYTESATTAGADPASNVFVFLPASLVTGLLIAALGFFCAKGSNRARIIVWVMGGGAVLNSLVFAQLAMRPAFYAGKPDWYAPLTITQTIIQILGVVTAATLLALPASRPFFRKP